ncbi:MAG TPA: two-component system response regulator [Gammaproteobacteria bacterium]|nr:two-component system response regulator [Gammaproteobacteria bacterium]|tara:strand:- start:4510 stop:4869 length:360 start_codon:yes stop_codon:yes gene_type:complete
MSKIIVVDDSKTEIFQFREMLEKLGYEVITAENGRDGVDLAKKEQPDVVLMDIVMPDMNGFQATRQITQGAETKHIPVIIVSSKDQETDKVWGERQGAKGYLTKPVNSQQRSSVMESFL